MIIAPERFHNCDTEILKLDFKRLKINLVSLMSSAQFPLLLIFLNFECVSYALRSATLKYKAQIKNHTNEKHLM